MKNGSDQGGYSSESTNTRNRFMDRPYRRRSSVSNSVAGWNSWSVVFMSSWTAKQIHKQKTMEEKEDKRNKDITKLLEGCRCPDERSYIKGVVTERRKV